MQGFAWRSARSYDATVAEVRITLTIDEEVLRSVRVRAARSGMGESEVIERAIRRGLELDTFERLWERNDLSDVAAMELALEAQADARDRG